MLSRCWLLLPLLPLVVFSSDALASGNPRPRRDVAAAQPDKGRDKAEAAGAGPSSWEVPAKQLSACQTASQAMQQLTGNAPGGMWVTHPTAEQWRQIIAKVADSRSAQAQELQAVSGLDVQEQELAGVRVYLITPPMENDPERLLVYTHGGAYVFNGGPASTVEGAFIARATRTKVLCVDYRMAPDHPFPAALDDAVAVWTEAVKGRDPSKVALLGTSAGGGLAMATVLRLKNEGKAPLPAALYLSTPWSDLSGAGDTYATLAFVDNMIVTYDGALGDAAAMYASGRDLKDPYLSPVYGDVLGFPPTLLLSGTRDLFLSNTVRVHRKLRQAGVPADLHVFEGLAHAQHVPLNDPVRSWDSLPPETVDALNEVATFFERTLGGAQQHQETKRGGK